MFPTLYPLGIGGFDIPDRETPLSFRSQVESYFNLFDHSFRYHRSFMFVALNIYQHRTAHLHTSFTVKKSHFTEMAKHFVALTPDIINSLADHLEHEKQLVNLDPKQKNALELLQKVNTISAHIPGSEASKIKTCNQIRSYYGLFGLSHIYITLNPCATHSPIFQVIFGDNSVDLSLHYPTLVNAMERALRLAKDPVAASDFFDFSIKAIFEHLFGWNFTNKESKPNGWILGHLKAWTGTVELTERGCYHGHFLIWLLGSMNPGNTHIRLQQDSEFKTRFFFIFFESISCHSLSDIAYALDPKFEPHCQHPPILPDTYFSEEALKDWSDDFLYEIKACGEVLQRHICRKVCHKYGNEGKCRFLFPHEIVDKSYFDKEKNSVFLMCHDATINFFNHYILVFSGIIMISNAYCQEKLQKLPCFTLLIILQKWILKPMKCFH